MGKFSEGLLEALTVFVRALAWWHAVPKPRPSKLKSQPAPDKRSRMQIQRDAGAEVELPDLDSEINFFVDMLFDAGPATAAGMGLVPLTWSDLDAWQRGSGVNLPPWQLRLLRKLSAEHLAELHRAEEFDAPPPWVRAMTEDRRARLVSHIKNVMRG